MDSDRSPVASLPHCTLGCGYQFFGGYERCTHERTRSQSYHMLRPDALAGIHDDARLKAVWAVELGIADSHCHAASTAHATEGAAEIARLTKDRDAWKETVFSADANAAQWCQRAEQAEAEIQRLRDQQGTVIAALKACVEALALPDACEHDPDECCVVCLWSREGVNASVVTQARKALALVESPGAGEEP